MLIELHNRRKSFLINRSEIRQVIQRHGRVLVSFTAADRVSVEYIAVDESYAEVKKAVAGSALLRVLRSIGAWATKLPSKLKARLRRSQAA